MELCRFWLDWDLRLLRPAVVVPVGGLAIRRLLGLNLRLDECIGSAFPFGDAVAVPLPHPSGASGWLNDPANRKRVERAAHALRRELRNAKAFASA
jgi:uracil-DNA glycosylase